MSHYIHISSLQDARIPDYFFLSENQLKHYFEPQKEGLFLAESPKVITRALKAGYEPMALLACEDQLNGEALSVLAQLGDIPFFICPEPVMNGITGYPMTRGLIAAMKRKALPSWQSCIESCRHVAILENVMNPTNIGAIFRSAAALGADAILLKDGCADPLYRRAVRVSMGTVFQIPWTVLPEAWQPSDLKPLGFTTLAMALKDNAIPINDPKIKGLSPLALMMGTEGEGLLDATIADCDYTVIIPMSHGVDSLNVAAATAVGMYALFE